MKADMVLQFLQMAADDWVGIWEVPWLVRKAGGPQDPDELLHRSMTLIRTVLQEELATVGSVTDAGFQAWDLNPDEACDRIESKWRHLSHDPRIGDMSCWFNLTEKGRIRILDGENGSVR